MPALWNKLSYKMLTRKANMHYPVWTPRFFVLLFTDGACSYHELPFKSPPRSTYGFKGNFQRWEMKGMGHSDTATLFHHHCPFVLVLGLVLVPTSPLHLFTQFYTPETHLSLSFLLSPKVHKNYVCNIYLWLL